MSCKVDTQWRLIDLCFLLHFRSSHELISLRPFNFFCCLNVGKIIALQLFIIGVYQAQTDGYVLMTYKIFSSCLRSVDGIKMLHSWRVNANFLSSNVINMPKKGCFNKTTRDTLKITNTFYLFYFQYTIKCLHCFNNLYTLVLLKSSYY